MTTEPYQQSPADPVPSDPSQPGPMESEETHSAGGGQRQCPTCGAPLQPNQTVCPECGTQLQKKPKMIRCRHCGKKGSSELVICPNCGRELKPAPSRWLTWGLPGFVVVLLVAVIATQVGANPLQWAQIRVDNGLGDIENVAITPVRQERGASEAAEGSEAAQLDITPSPSPTNQPEAGPTDQGTEAEQQTAAMASAATNEGVAVATSAPPTAAATVAPTASPTPTATVTPRATPTSTPEPTAGSTGTSAATPTGVGTYTVQAGDTLVGIATRFDISVLDLLNANNMAPQDALELQVGRVLLLPGVEDGATQTYTVQTGDTLVGIAIRMNVSSEALMRINGISTESAKSIRPGQVLIIPPSSTAVTVGRQPASTATPTPITQRYTVRSGDTISAIASRFDVSVDAIRGANNLSVEEAALIRPGQELVIPTPGQVFPTPTPGPVQSTATTPKPAVETTNYRLDAPSLLNPVDGVNVQCHTSAPQFIQWEKVNSIAPDDGYVLFLGYINGPAQPDGSENITWLLRQPVGQQTSWKMDPEYCNLAPQEFGREWRWYVQVFDNGTAVSPASEVRAFTWR